MKNITLALAAAAFLAAPALAGSDEIAVNAELDYSASALEANPERVLSSLEDQALDACNKGVDMRDLQSRRFAKSCARDIVAKAVKRIDHPALTAAFTGAPRYANTGDAHAG